MLDIQIGTRTLFAPKHWNDLDFAQMLGCITAVAYSDKHLTQEDRMWAIGQVILQITPAERQQIASACTPDLGKSRFAQQEAFEIGQTAAIDILRQLCEQVTSFAFAKTDEPYLDPNDISDKEEEDDEQEELPLSIAFTRTKQVIQTIALPADSEYGCLSLYAPKGDGLENISLMEFIATSYHYVEASRANNVHDRQLAVARIVATLWRPLENGKRIPFSSDNEHFEKIAQTISQMQPAVLEAIWFWYASSYEQVRLKFPALFHAQPSGKTSARSQFGMVGMLYELSSDVTQVDIVANKPLFDILSYASYQVAASQDAVAAG